MALHHRKVLSRETILNILKQQKPILKEKYGVTRLGLFGSAARNQTNLESDLDVVMEIERPNLFVAVNIKEELEYALGLPVDLVRYREHMNPHLKRRLEREAIYV
jgi:hypothetical protein